MINVSFRTAAYLEIGILLQPEIGCGATYQIKCSLSQFHAS